MCLLLYVVVLSRDVEALVLYQWLYMYWLFT